MASFSFDIVSEFDKAEINNVFDQVKREITSRYDFKNTPANLEWLDADKNGFKITGNSEWQIESILEIVRKKLSARNQSQKILDISVSVVESNLKTTKDVPFVQGLNQDKAKQITKIIQADLPKVKTQIQAEIVRATSASKDDLQSAMRLLEKQDYAFPLKFTNFR